MSWMKTSTILEVKMFFVLLICTYLKTWSSKTSLVLNALDWLWYNGKDIKGNKFSIIYPHQETLWNCIGQTWENDIQIKQKLFASLEKTNAKLANVLFHENTINALTYISKIKHHN